MNPNDFISQPGQPIDEAILAELALALARMEMAERFLGGASKDDNDIRALDEAASSSLHTAADSHVAAVKVAVRYAFAKGRQFLAKLLPKATTTEARNALAEKIGDEIERELLFVMPGTLTRAAISGALVGAELLEGRLRMLGGRGSGNFDHEGRPGKVGGSGPGGITSSIGHIAHDGSIQTEDFKGPDDEIKNPRGEVVGHLTKADQKEHDKLWPGRMGMPSQRFRMQPVEGLPGMRIQWLDEPTADDYFAVQDYYERKGVTIVDQFVSGTGLKSIDPRKLRAAEEFRAAKKTESKTIKFNVINKRAATWARKHVAEMVTDISETSRKAIKRAIAGLLEGENYRSVLDKISQAVGDDDRAELIARHETMSAVSAGQRQAWDQAVDDGLLTGHEKRVWIAVPVGACPICEELDGTTANLDGKYPDGSPGPPRHVKCRCTEGLQ